MGNSNQDDRKTFLPFVEQRPPTRRADRDNYGILV